MTMTKVSQVKLMKSWLKGLISSKMIKTGDLIKYIYLLPTK
jgi:hypothetical protein